MSFYTIGQSSADNWKGLFGSQYEKDAIRSYLSNTNILDNIGRQLANNTNFGEYAAKVENNWKSNPFVEPIASALGGITTNSASTANSNGVLTSTNSNVDVDWESLLNNFMNNYQSATDKANAISRENAQKQMDFQREMAQAQMDFQREMSNTSYQRAVKDMEAAGLNPLMLYGSMGNGASTPSGSSASGANATTFKSSDVFTDIIGGIVMLLGAVTSAFKAK